MSLTEDEKRRIQEEEGFRAEARVRAEQTARKKLEKEQKTKKAREGCLGCLGLIVIVVVAIALLGQGSNSSSVPSVGTSTSSDKKSDPSPDGTATLSDKKSGPFPAGMSVPNAKESNPSLAAKPSPGATKSDASPAGKSAPGAKKSSSAPTAKSAPAELSDAECMKDLQCWGERHFVSASVRCPDEVVRLANFTARWTDGWLGTKFSHYRWRDQARGIVTYIGDKVEFQNGFGAWQSYTYECDLKCDHDSTRDVVLDVRAAPGRMATR